MTSNNSSKASEGAVVRVLNKMCAMAAVGLLLFAGNAVTSSSSFAQAKEDSYARGVEKGKTEAEAAHQELSRVKDEDHKKLIRNRYRRRVRSVKKEIATLTKQLVEYPDDETTRDREKYAKGVEAGLRSQKID